MFEYKGVPAEFTGAPPGEAFEIAAFDADEEAGKYPSVVGFEDGSALELSALLTANADAILGPEFVARYGACVPLLPKTLDVKELLSVQGHPPGNTEVYVIIDADPGATIRLGFSADIDSTSYRDSLVSGRRRQAELIELLRGDPGLDDLQSVLAPWLGRRGAPANDLLPALEPFLEANDDWPAAQALLEELKLVYWRVLDSLNMIPVSAGQVIYNATPARLLAGPDARQSAEVHALGNPEGREILALEVRRPGPTFRAWDNVRFPVRDIDIDAALDALNLTATTAEDFIVAPELIPGRVGVLCSVDSPSFRVEHLRPGGEPEQGVTVPAEPPHCLHVVRGTVELRSESGEDIGTLSRGESALVPVGVGAYVASAREEGVEIVKVGLPL
jgi:mannose-6-phosphate isomerase class I